MTDRRSISRSAFKVSLGSALALVAGLASQIAIAWLFGTGKEMDAFLTALVVPTYLQMVLLSGLSFVFIPAFVREEASEHHDIAWAMARTVLCLVGGGLLVIALVCSLCAHWIISVMAPGLDAAESSLAGRLLTVMAFTLPLYGIGSLSQGIENARDRYFWPAFAPAMGSLVNVAALLLLYNRFGPMALAWGSLASAAARSAVTFVPVLRRRWPPGLRLNDRRLLEMLRLTAPFVLFSVFTYSTGVLERYFASSLPDGSLSNLGYAGKISSILVMVLGAGIATAIFPALARVYATEGIRGLVERTEFGLRLSAATALPAIAIASALAVPIVSVLFQRGAFGRSDTTSVALVVPWILLSDLLCRMIGNVTGRTLFVLKDTFTTPFIGACSTAIYVVAAMWLVRQWGYLGLGVAMFVQMGLSNAVILLLLSRRLPQLRTANVLSDAARYAVASAVAAACAWSIATALHAAPALVQLVLGGASAAAVYFALLARMDRAMAASLLEISGVASALKRLGWQRLFAPAPGEDVAGEIQP